MHNSRLKSLINKMLSDVKSAENEADLIKIIDEAISFGEPLKYDNTIQFLLSGFCCIFIAVFVSMVYFSYGVIHQNAIVISLIISVIGVMSFVFTFMRRSEISDISNRIFEKDILFDNRLSIVQIKGSEHASNLSSVFHEFERGNHSREIRSLNAGNYSGESYSFDYHIYNFHYVNKKIVNEKDGIWGGKAGKKTIYDRKNRYGIYLPFSFVGNIAILGFGAPGFEGKRLKQESSNFNKRYKVYSAVELDAKRFLNSEVLTAFEGVGKIFKGLNFEFSSDARLCMSFEDSDLISAKRTYGLDDPIKFLAEIEAYIPVPKLDKALNHIHLLMKHSPDV
jgi:hypothetical protein